MKDYCELQEKCDKSCPRCKEQKLIEGYPLNTEYSVPMYSKDGYEGELQELTKIKEECLVIDDFLEMMMYGSIGYRVKEDGSYEKLTQEELWKVRKD